MNREYFGPVECLDAVEPVMTKFRNFYNQERDWTCSIACIRTLLSSIREAVPSEEDIRQNEPLIPGPQYSKEICNWKIMQGVNAIYGCDTTTDDKHPAGTLYQMLKDGYAVMIETMVNFDHWIVVTGIYPNGQKDISKVQVTYYDPYPNEVRMIYLEELMAMWCSGLHTVNRVYFDFVAVK